MNKILFSIIIPAYNEADYLPACIEACQKQIGNLSYEIIVVDNNSTDNTFAVAFNLAVKVIKQEKPGVGWARKKGVDESQGEYIVSIDADTHLPIDYLSEVYKRFQEKKDLVCLGGGFYFYDGQWWQNVLRLILHWPLYLFAYIFSLGKLGPMGNNMVFKKEFYEMVNGFNPELKYGEDADLTRKLSKYGKIKLDMKLKCGISARRFTFKDKNFFIYVLNFFELCLVGRPYKNELASHDTGPLTK